MRILSLVAVLLAALAACEDKKAPAPATDPAVEPPPVTDTVPPASAKDAAVPSEDAGAGLELGASQLCEQPQSREGLCACLFDSLDPEGEFGFDDEHDDDLEPREPAPKCRAVGKTVADVAIWRVSEAKAAADDNAHGFFLVAKIDKEFRALAILRSDLGRTRHTLATYRPGSIEQRMAGNRGYLWVEGRERDGDFDGGVTTEIETRQVTLCPLPIALDTRCPLQVPVRTVTKVELEWDEPDSVADFRATWGQDSPVVLTVDLRVEVRDDGTAAVSLAGGKATDSIEPYIGSHRIW